MFARDLNSFVEYTVQTCAQNDSMGYGLLGHIGQTLCFSQCFDKKFKYLHSNYHQIKSSTSCSFSPVPTPPSKNWPISQCTHPIFEERFGTQTKQQAEMTSTTTG